VKVSFLTNKKLKQYILWKCYSERSKAKGPELQPGCKALGYWDDKSEENFLRTTTDDDGQKWHNLISGFPQIVLFLFLRFFQIFYTKMFPKLFCNIFTLKWSTQALFQSFYTKMVTKNTYIAFTFLEFLFFKKGQIFSFVKKCATV
jgi:hypothetical protein